MKKKNFLRQNQLLCTLSNWINQFFNPIRLLRAVPYLVRYLRDWYRYSHLSGAKPSRLIDSWPQLHDRTQTSPIDTHYFYVNAWAIRRISEQKVLQHVDIGSQNQFVNMLSAVVQTVFLDLRPLNVRLKGLINCQGDLLNLPFKNQSIESLSCLHVAEHIGLGRYGDPLNPLGTGQACAELSRVLAPGGHLYFSLPVGKQRVCFNAHRVFEPESILDYLSSLQLLEFSGIHDDGRYVERIGLGEFAGSHYACGMFLFRKAPI